MPTEVSHAWLDRIVTARQRLSEVHSRRLELQRLLQFGDCETNDYFDEASEILHRDGAEHRFTALTARTMQLTVELIDAEKHGATVGPILQGLTEVADALQETILNTEALLADARELQVQRAEEYSDIDRLEEHPAYERL
jgi:hypothetical protein